MGLAKRRPLTLFKDNDYRVQREWGKITVQRQITSTWYEDGSSYTWWDTLTYLDGYDKCAFVNRSGKLALNKEYRAKGQLWIAHWKVLLASNMWEVQCNDWDGQGTRCPLQREVEGIPGCVYRFSFHGYGGGLNNWHPLPGKCTGPLNRFHSDRVCAPSREDEHGFSMNHLARIRAEIWKRKGDTQ
jgi:hypothetical protein